MSSSTFFTDLRQSCGPETAKHVALRASEMLFRQGDTPIGLALVQSGQMDLVRWTEAGRAVRIHSARRGETFAEASLFAQSCHCDAVAAVDTTVCILPRRTVLNSFTNAPDLSTRFAAYLAQSLMDARRLLELRAIHPLTEGLMARLAEVVDENDNLPQSIPLLSLAQDLDVTPPALYRALAQLEKEGRVMRPARGRVHVLAQKLRGPV